MQQVNERSFGIVPVQFQNEKPYVFLVQHTSGAWLFPKGRAEINEKPKEAAVRELHEETNLKIIRWFDLSPYTEHYTFFRDQKKIFKEVCYFVAEVDGEILLQKNEVLDGKWVELEHLGEHVSFPEMQSIARALIQDLF